MYGKWWDGSDWQDQPTAVTKTAAVKSKDANDIGLYDMSGNVWEWCFDWYNDSPISNDDAYTEASIVTDPQGAAPGSTRVSRGGSWNRDATRCTVGYRGSDNPANKFNSVGFRLACLP